MGEHVAHAKDVSVELDASGEIVDVERDVVDEVTKGFRVGGRIRS